MSPDPEQTPAAPGSPRLRRRVWVALALVAATAALMATVDVTIADPRVAIRWDTDVDAARRAALEGRYDLRNGVPDESSTATWRYDLADESRDNVRALVQDPAVADTAFIDRNAFAAPPRDVRISLRYPYDDLFDSPAQLLRLHRSVWLLLGGALLFWAAQSPSGARRRIVGITVLALVTSAALLFPFDPSFVTMGGSADHVRSRADFESWFGGRVRFEKHLSQVMLLELYEQLGASEAAPERAVIAVSRVAALWFLLSALVVGAVERWSALAVRYLALVLLAPATLLYFGWREFGYLALTPAAFPLLARGLKDGSMRLEAGSAFAGVGAALHGAGLVSLAGAWIAAWGARGRLRERFDRAMRVAAWGTAAYLVWVAIYVIVLHLPIRPDAGAATYSPWRPWAADDVRLGRVSPAVLSATGGRDLLMAAWVVGAPLVVAALSLWRRYAHEVRVALLYLPPSLLFLVFRWPFDGVGGGMDLVVAGFPALYALAWVCAHDAKRTGAAAVLLASAHYAFWRVVLDDRFDTVQID